MTAWSSFGNRPITAGPNNVKRMETVLHNTAVARRPGPTGTWSRVRKAWIMLVFIPAFVQGQEPLPRKVFLGIRMENITAEQRLAERLGDLKAVRVREVLPGGSGAAAGWQAGDLITGLNGKEMGSTAQVIDEVARHDAGSTMAYRLVKAGKARNGKLKLVPWPLEQYPDLQVDYTTHLTVNGVQRGILTRPKAAPGTKRPLVVFIGGIGCYSLDAPLDTARSEVQLLNALSRAGYACARLEKPGMGDAQRSSTPCNQVGFMDEMAGYAAMIAQLKQRPDIDSTEVTVIGHSMGGLFAPLVAQHTPVQRIIAYGTIGSNFPEYLVKTRRTIGEAYGWDAARTDAYIKEFCHCAVWYFADHMTTAEAASKDSSCAEHLGVFDLRSRKYNDELYAVSVPRAWEGYTGKTLLLWGEADFIASRHDHELLYGQLEARHPGQASFRVVKDADHGMDRADDFQAAVAGSAPYQANVAHEVLAWMRSMSPQQP